MKERETWRLSGTLKWDSLKQRRKQNQLISFFKDLSGKPSILTDYLIHPVHGRTDIYEMLPLPVPIPPRMSSDFPYICRSCSRLRRQIFLLGKLYGLILSVVGPSEGLSGRRVSSKQFRIKIYLHHVELSASIAGNYRE